MAGSRSHPNALLTGTYSPKYAVLTGASHTDALLTGTYYPDRLLRNTKVSSWRRILNRRPKSDDLIVNQSEPLRNISLLSGRVARMSVLDQSDEESEESRRPKERKATLPDIRLLPIQSLPTTLPTVPVRSTNTEPQS